MRLWSAKQFLVAAICAAFSTVAGVSTAAAHHSFAAYDHGVTHKWSGTVSAYDWRNPHIYVDVVFAGKGSGSWSLEATAIPMLTRLGWRKNTLKPGDKITAQFAPMKNGAKGGVLMEITFEDGKVMNTGLPGQDSYAKPTAE
jgi:Family of unknown function (DUF6152)